MIKIKGVSKDFSDGSNIVTVLKKTTLELYEGEFNAIIGPSGSGKSTLLTIMGALQKPSLGNLYIQGKDVYKLTENERSNLRFNSIGFILQGSNLVPYLTIQEQFELKLKTAKKKENKSAIMKILDELEISHIKNKYPENISGGERQRAAIGLALLLEPPLLLADEPTASLDTETAFQVVNLLKKISETKNTCVVMVTHDNRMLSYCDRVFMMNDGVLKES